MSDIVERLRRRQSDMSEAIDSMDKTAGGELIDNGLMTTIRYESLDLFKTAADELESLRSRLAKLQGGEACCVTHGEGACQLTCTKCNDELRSRLADAEREARVLVVAMADQFGAPDNWKPLPDAAGMITQISNMVAGLRKDAERYRWLRDKKHPSLGLTRLVLNDTPHGIDAAIDAAMGESHE